MEKFGVRIFRCKHCQRSVALSSPVCLNCGTSRPASRCWHIPLLIALVIPLTYALLSVVLS